MSDKPKNRRTSKSEPRPEPKPEPKVEPIPKPKPKAEPKAPEKASGSDGRGRSRSPRGEAKAKAKAKPRNTNPGPDVPRRTNNDLPADNETSETHWKEVSMGYIKEQLQLRGVKISKEDEKKTY